MPGYIYAGQWGHTHTITVQDQDSAVVDVSAATALQMVFRRENAVAEITKTATLVTDGTDGKIRYAVAYGDSVDATRGDWLRWAVVTWADGSYTSTPERYTVYAPGAGA